VKKCKLRELRWTKDEDDSLYFAWIDQVLLQEAFVLEKWKETVQGILATKS
jgi:hypothetical protein